MQKYEHLKVQYLLNPEITFLNFGSFGACPKPVFEAYQQFQLELEREPVQFITVKGLEYLKAAREKLADYIHCEAEDVVFMTNPSYAVNTVAKSLRLNPGDEILTTSIEYGACDKTWDFVCEATGAKYIRQPIPFPILSKDHFIDAFFKGLTDRTKVVFISQITSATGLILPVKEICEIAKSKGLMTFVDGAHVPGHIDLNLSALQADIYVGACHKWMMAPKGSSFLYVRKEWQPKLDPLVVSWGYKALFPSDSQFLDHHQMMGTRDYSAFLAVSNAIDFLKANNWPEVVQDCREIVQSNAFRFCELVGTSPIAPIDNEFIGQMFSIPVHVEAPEKLQRYLYEKYKIEIPVMRQNDATFIRYSINAFNSQNDLDILYAALKETIATTDFIEVKK